MRKNKLKKIFAEGKAAINGWLQIPNSFSAEVMASQGWESLTIDMQHGVVDYPNSLQMLQAISTTDVVPMARVNWNEPGQIMKILDAGSYGIICPMVSNRKEAENFVRACLYPPKGFRSFGPIRGLLYGGADYGKYANDDYVTYLTRYRASIAATTFYPTLKYWENAAAGCLTFMEITEKNDGTFIVFKDNESCIFINENNYQNKFQEYLSDPDNPKWEEIAKSGRDFAMNKLNNDIAVETIVELIKKLIN